MENATTHPIAINGDSAVEAAPSAQLIAEAVAAPVIKTKPVQTVLIVLGTIAFLYFARPVVLPIVFACVAGMTLKPLIRWLSNLAHSAGSLRRGRSLSFGVRLCHWFLPTGPAGAGVDE